MSVWAKCLDPGLIPLVLPHQQRHPMGHYVHLCRLGQVRWLVSLQVLDREQAVEIPFTAVNNNQDLTVSRSSYLQLS